MWLVTCDVATDAVDPQRAYTLAGGEEPTSPPNLEFRHGRTINAAMIDRRQQILIALIKDVCRTAEIEVYRVGSPGTTLAVEF
jgi:hypothetical protein